MPRLSLTDDCGTFEVTLLDAPRPERVALFAVGAGGNPERHLPLLVALAEHGVTVVAPHFERLVSGDVSERDLLLRARRLASATEVVAPKPSAVVGVGHSMGATVLLAMAGAQAWMGPGRPVAIPAGPRFQRLILLAPATGYFQTPGALDGMCTPVLVWVGSGDTVTPPWQADLLKKSLMGRVPVEVHVEEGAGHFSFMHTPPPHLGDLSPQRELFLSRLTADLVGFATAEPMP